MDWKKIGKKLLFPPVWFMVLLTVISATLLIAVFIKGWEQTVPAYAVYVLSFYTLSVLTVFCVMVLPKQYGTIKKRIYDNPLGNRYMTDRVFRTKVSLNISLAVSMLYAAVNIWFWHILQSWWFVVLALYYVIMAVMRFLLVRYVRLQKIGANVLGEWKRARACAYILLLINISLSGAVLMILYNNRGYDYPGIMIYVMALYTFYSTIYAIVEIVKHRSMESPVMSAAKVVSLSAALVSMLNLETAMFNQFGAEMAQKDQKLMIILTGAGISATICALSVLLIVKATKEIRRAKYGK